MLWWRTILEQVAAVMAAKGHIAPAIYRITFAACRIFPVLRLTMAEWDIEIFSVFLLFTVHIANVQTQTQKYRKAKPIQL